MAAYLDDKYQDVSLQAIKDDNENLYILSAEPTEFADIATYKLGTKATPTISNPQAGDVSGRKLIVSAITDGVVDAAGDATWWCLADDSLSVLQVAQELTALVAIVTGSPFTLDALDCEFPNPAA